VYDVFNPYPDEKFTVDGKWKVHDMNRPQPPRVAPDEARQKELAVAPAGAVSLDYAKWKDTRVWHDENGLIVCHPAPRDLESLAAFGSCRVHLEWQAPAESTRSGQGRANSGAYFMSLYEVQILDSYENQTYPDGTAGAVYGVKPPDANALRPSGEWQYYDIWFKRPTFDDQGAMVTPACVTVYLNGVLVQDNTAYAGPTTNGRTPSYRAHPDRLPFKLQYHGETISFRNIWIQPLDDNNVIAPAGPVGRERPAK
jgi:hypothetical protein